MEIETLDDALQYLEDHRLIDGLFASQESDDGTDYDYDINKDLW